MPDSLDSWAAKVLAGDRRAMSRAISAVEDREPEGRELVKRLFPKTGRAFVIGVTGAPGAGKSGSWASWRLNFSSRVDARKPKRMSDRSVSLHRSERSADLPHNASAALIYQFYGSVPPQWRKEHNTLCEVLHFVQDDPL